MTNPIKSTLKRLYALIIKRFFRTEAFAQAFTKATALELESQFSSLVERFVQTEVFTQAIKDAKWDHRPQEEKEQADRRAAEARSIGARFQPLEPQKSTVIVPAQPAYQNDGEHLGFPIPPESLRLSYGTSPDEYIILGKRHVEMMMGLLRQYRFELTSGQRVLELGCAAARMLRHFADRAQDIECWGADIDSQAILWCQRHLSPPFKFTTTTTFPSLPFEDNYFNLIFAGSVFTHIFDLADSWLLELRRVLVPGGIAYLTIHDENTISEVMSWPPGHWGYNSILRKQILEFDQQTGLAKKPFAEFTVQRDAGFAQVFHSQNYVRSRWGQYFEVLAVEKNAYEYQAAVILRK